VRLRVSVNGQPQYVAGFDARGHIGSHVNAESGEATDASLGTSGFDTTDQQVTLYREWSKVSLKVGDKVEIECVDDVPLSPPESEKRSIDDPRIAITDRELAAEVAERVNEIDQALENLLEVVSARESAENARRFQRAVGEVLWEIGQKVIAPLHNAFPELRPNLLRDDPL
jgi:hypothetical protein